MPCSSRERLFVTKQLDNSSEGVPRSCPSRMKAPCSLMSQPGTQPTARLSCKKPSGISRRLFLGLQPVSFKAVTKPGILL